MSHSSYIPKGEITYSIWNSPLGSLGLVARGEKLAAIAFRAEPDSFPFQVERTYGHPGRDSDAVFAETRKQLTEYFEGRRLVFRLPLDLDQGTPFQQKVWNALLDIPYGQRVSYKQIAETIGRSLATRAVGSANGANPIPIVAPCHRVIASGGGLGGFSGGLDIKRKLLALETETLANAARLGVEPGDDSKGRYRLWP